MARPSTGPEFATTATYPLDGSGWQGTATRSDPGSTRRAIGWEPAALFAQALNFVQGLHGDWLAYLRDERDRFAASLEPSGLQYFTIPAAAFGDGARNTANAVWSYDAATGSLVATTAFQEWAAVYLDAFLPTGAAIAEVKALVKPGGVDPVTMRIATHSLNFAGSTVGRSVEVGYSGAVVNVSTMRSSGSTMQSLSTGTLSPTLAVTRSSTSAISLPQTNRVVEIQNSGTSVDRIYGLRIAATLPTARNW